jgi:hypothetical protein
VKSSERTNRRWKRLDRERERITGVENGVFRMIHHITDGQFTENGMNTFASFENIMGQFVQGMFFVTIDFGDELNEDECRSRDETSDFSTNIG